MIRGVYSAASAMVSNFRRQAIVSNNLANVFTTGYKQDVVASSDSPGLPVLAETGGRREAFRPRAAIGEIGLGTELDEIQLDLSPGDLEETGNPLDLAISGSGYFAVQTPSGTFYTRDGVFFSDALGRLARTDGGLLLGEDGPIQAGPGEVLVDGDGTVNVNGQAAGRIRLVDFDPTEQLLKLGNNYLAPANPGAQALAAEGAAINQGFLERSNVDLTRAMGEMLSAMRAYEASQKLLQLQDQTLDRAVNDIAKV